MKGPTLSALIALGIAAGGCTPDDHGRAPETASVLLILIDTLRADHLSLYGYPHLTSPAIDRIGSEGVVFRDCTSVACWTNPAIAALFSGRTPCGVLSAVPWAEAIELALPPEVDTLAEILRRADYRTVALVDHPGIKQELNYDQGFDTFVRLFDKRGYHNWVGSPAEYVLQDVTEQLESLGSSPFFCYVHVVYPHRPYQAPASYNGLFSAVATVSMERYDEEIRYADDLVAEIAVVLERLGRAADTMLIITSDHGEGFFEHGHDEHGNSFYREVLDVPLVVRPPGGWACAPHVVEDPVSLADVFPTVLAAAGVTAPEGAAGENLLPYLRSARHLPGRRTLFSENAYRRCIHGLACREGRFKLIYEPATGGPLPSIDILRQELTSGAGCRLFDLAADPREKRDVTARYGEKAGELRRLALRHLEGAEAARATLLTRRSPLPADDAEKLRSLGYIR